MLEAQSSYTGNKISEPILQSILYNYSNNYFVGAMQGELTGFFPDSAVTVLPTVLSKIGQHRPKTVGEYAVFKYRNPRETFNEDHECIVHRGLMRLLTIT